MTTHFFHIQEAHTDEGPEDLAHILLRNCPLAEKHDLWSTAAESCIQPCFPIVGPTGSAAIETGTPAREQPGQGGGFLAPHVERLFQLHRLDSGADRQGPGEGHKASTNCRLAESTLGHEHLGVH